MNHQDPRSLREQFEVRIIALLLGEASDFEEAELLDALEHDPELKAFYNRMRQTVTQLEQSLAPSVPSGSKAPKLSPERRKQLEQLFEQPATKPSATRPLQLLRPKLNSRRNIILAIAAAVALLLVASGLLLPAKISKNETYNRWLGEPAPAANDQDMLAQREQRPRLGGQSDEKHSKHPGGVNRPVPQSGQQEATTLSITSQPEGAVQTAAVSDSSALASVKLAPIFLPGANPAGQEPVARANRPLSRERFEGIEPAEVPRAGSPVPAAPPVAAANGTLDDRFSASKDAANAVSDLGSAAPGTKPFLYKMDPLLASRYGLKVDPRAATSRNSAAVVPPTGPAQPDVARLSKQKVELAQEFEGAEAVERSLAQAGAGSPSGKRLDRGFGGFSTSNSQPNAGQGSDQFGRPLPPSVSPPPLAIRQVLVESQKVADLANPNAAAADVGRDLSSSIAGGGGGVGGGGFGDSISLGYGPRNDRAPVTVTGSSGAPNSPAAMFDSFAADGMALPTNSQAFFNEGRLVIRAPEQALDSAGKAVNTLDHSVNAAIPPEAAAESKQGVAASKPLSAATPLPAARPKLPEDEKAKAKNREGELANEKAPQLGDTPTLGRLLQRAEPLPEISAKDNPFSTFSLNVSDVSFQLAAASLEKNRTPEAVQIRSEEFVNAFDYHDPAPAPGQRVAFAWERARNSFAHNRELLRFSVQTAALGRQPGQPLNLVVVLDNSGSMERADRVRIIEEMMTVLAGQLRPEDRVSVIAFARTAHLIVDGMAGGDPKALLRRVLGLNPSGGTNFEEAMKLGYETAAKHFLAHGNNRVILLTDGAANLGDVDPQTLRERVVAQRQKGIALDCFGIGWEDYNDHFLEILSRNGDGRYAFINDPEAARTEFAAKLAGALQIAAADVKVQIEFNPNRVILYRQIGYQQHQLTKEQFRDNRVDAAEIGAAESGNALYSVELDLNGNGPIGTFRLRYRVPSTGVYEEREWPLPYTQIETPLDQASPALRLAATAASFAEWLAKSPYAQAVTPEALLNLLRGVPEIYAPDPRPRRLLAMIEEARAINAR